MAAQLDKLAQEEDTVPQDEQADGADKEAEDADKEAAGAEKVTHDTSPGRTAQDKPSEGAALSWPKRTKRKT